MEYRKLISFGNSSYVVSLPKNWLEKNNLIKGDTVYMDIDGTNISISPQKSTTREKEVEQVIEIDNTDLGIISRKINSAYINNADVLTIVGNSLGETARDIKKIIQNLMAMETISQTTEKIVARSFLNMADVDIPGLIRRADHIVHSMIDELKTVRSQSKEKGIEAVDSINQRDEDVNRICFLIFRALNKQVMSSTHVLSDNPLKIWGIVYFMEEIADEVKRIARQIPEIKNGKTVEKYMELIAEIKDNYKNCMKAFYTNDKKLVYDVSSQRIPLFKKCDSIMKLESSNPAAVMMIDKTKSMVDKIHSLNRMSY